MLRVMLDCRMLDWSGVGRYSRGLVNALAARGDLDLIPVTASGGVPDGLSSGLDAVTARQHPFSLRGRHELAAIAAKVQPEVVHCLHFPTPARQDAPLVVTIHDLIPLIVPASMPSAMRRAVYREANRIAVRHADQFIVPSSATARDLSRMFPASHGKTTIIPEAADDFSAGPMGELPAEMASGKRFVLGMGNTRPHKDLPTLLAAFERLAASHSDVDLVLVGREVPGYLESHLSDAVLRRARFTGHVDDRTLRALYSAATVFAFPSRCEGFGLPPLEAMSLGTPVVVADAASLGEVVGDAGLFFSPGDVSALAEALSQLVDDADVRGEIAERGRQRAATFSWASTAEQTVAVYRALTGAHS